VVALGGVASGEIPSEGLYLVVTLGTGIGGTIIIDGAIAYGSGHAGEFGHMTVEADGMECPCGSRGCWEIYAARDALIRYYREAGGEMPSDPRRIASEAAAGEPSALAAFTEFGRWTGIGLASLGMCFDPAGIFLAGGLSCNYGLFREASESEFAGRCTHRYRVSAVHRPDEAGARGAAHMAAARLG
jgi:glucokinase